MRLGKHTRYLESRTGKIVGKCSASIRLWQGPLIAWFHFQMSCAQQWFIGGSKLAGRKLWPIESRRCQKLGQGGGCRMTATPFRKEDTFDLLPGRSQVHLPTFQSHWGQDFGCFGNWWPHTTSSEEREGCAQGKRQTSKVYLDLQLAKL